MPKGKIYVETMFYMRRGPQQSDLHPIWQGSSARFLVRLQPLPVMGIFMGLSCSKVMSNPWATLGGVMKDHGLLNRAGVGGQGRGDPVPAAGLFPTIARTRSSGRYNFRHVRSFQREAARLMNVNATRDSSDGVLRVKLVEHDPRTGNGQIQIIELRKEHARYFVTVLYGLGQQRIDYKTYDLMKATVFAFQARPNEDVTDITIVAVPAG
jgi:hypothetical protein